MQKFASIIEEAKVSKKKTSKEAKISRYDPFGDDFDVLQITKNSMGN